MVRFGAQMLTVLARWTCERAGMVDLIQHHRGDREMSSEEFHAHYREELRVRIEATSAVAAPRDDDAANRPRRLASTNNFLWSTKVVPFVSA